MQQQVDKENKLKQTTFLSSINFYLKSSVREAGRRKLYFCLALASTLIAVTATAVSLTVMSYTPIIFLKASESNTGAIDVQIAPLRASFNKYDGLNTQASTQNLLLNSTAVNVDLATTFSNVATSRYTYACTIRLTNWGYSGCGSSTSPPYSGCPRYTTSIDLQDSTQENKLGMAKEINFPSEIPAGWVVITKSLAKYLKVSVGDTIIVAVDVSEILREAVVQYNVKQTSNTYKIDDSQLQNSVSYIPFRIYRTMSSLKGKYPDSDDDHVVSEYKYFFQVLAAYPPVNGASASSNYVRFLNFLNTENPKNYANRIFFNLPNRMEAYTDSNFDRIQTKVTNFASRVSAEIGQYPYTMTLPVFDDLIGMKYAGLFLGIVLNIVIVILFILSTILIYNLLLVTVETKTFELGVIRMLGLTKLGVGQLILVQALMFALPGIVLGLIVSLPLLYFVGGVLETNFGVNMPITPNGKGLFWSLFIGFLIPIISSYYPMKEALGKNLNMALNLTRSKTNAVQVSVEINSKRIPWPQIVFGLLSIVFGVALYIILPLSLLSMNAGLLLALFFCILIGLLLGMTLLSLNFQHLMERLITLLFFFWTKSSFRTLILKNLVAHKLRNRQTAIMYSLSLGFILFIIVALNQVLNNLAYQTQARKGAPLEITSSTGLLSQYSILENSLAANLSDAVESYTWITQDLRSYMINNGMDDVVLMNKGRLYSVIGLIRGVGSRTFKTTVNKYLKVDKQDEHTGLDLAQQLYTPRGSQGIIIGKSYAKTLGASLDIDSSVILSIEDGQYTRNEELRVTAIVESAPGFKFSQIPSVTSQDMLISLPTYMRLAGDRIATYDKIPMQRLLIKAKGDSDANLDKIVNELTRVKQDQYSSLSIWDFRSTEDTLDSNMNTLSFVFKAVEALVMVLTLFSLITSMSTNILEQTKEIAVLRAVGMTRFKVNMLFVSEAFVLVVSSAIFGVVIGTVVGWTLSIQQVLFTQLPLIFHFPFSDLIVIFIAAVLSAFISAYFPAKRVTKYQISRIIRLG